MAGMWQMRNTPQALDFSGSGSSKGGQDTPPRTGPKCSLLQEFIEDLEPEKHRKRLRFDAQAPQALSALSAPSALSALSALSAPSAPRFDATVSEATLKRAIKKLECKSRV